MRGVFEASDLSHFLGFILGWPPREKATADSSPFDFAQGANDKQENEQRQKQ
jgi:hypothetical protein